MISYKTLFSVKKSITCRRNTVLVKLLCLTPISTVISWQNLQCPEKITDLYQATDKHYHIKLHQVHLIIDGIKPITLAVIGTDCIGRCKSYYHTIKAKTVPNTLEKKFSFNKHLKYIVIKTKSNFVSITFGKI